MADGWHTEETRELFVPIVEAFAREVESIAQRAADAEAVLHANDKPAGPDVRLEYELAREVECWNAARGVIDRRIADREQLLELRRAERAG